MARSVINTYDPASDTVTQTVRYHRVAPEHCAERTPKGICDRPLDERGYCGHERSHVDG